MAASGKAGGCPPICTPLSRFLHDIVTLARVLCCSVTEIQQGRGFVPVTCEMHTSIDSFNDTGNVLKQMELIYYGHKCVHDTLDLTLEMVWLHSSQLIDRSERGPCLAFVEGIA
jgi:hypothetical protein